MSNALSTGNEVPTIELLQEPTIELLQELQTIRRHCIRSQSRCDRSIEDLIARSIGYHSGLEEADRKKVFKTAHAVRLKVEADIKNGIPGTDPRIPAEYCTMIETSFIARTQWDRQRINIEKQMIETSRNTVAWPWVKSISGIAELGLAVIIGEAGDIGNYSGPAKLWKRLGLACVDGFRQGMVPKEITGVDRKEAWKQRGYNPSRRAEVWAFIDDVMFRAQWRGDKDEDGKNPKLTKKPIAVPAHARGPYGKVYGERKEWNLARGLNPAHANNEARRFMAKRFIRDLWVAWHQSAALMIAAE